ncbi:hypothetical protein N7540_003187 [Penicillium herquei]|nr:hypothetical protein N7540_003187 [Penicillium herquei]
MTKIKYQPLVSRFHPSDFRYMKENQSQGKPIRRLIDAEQDLRELVQLEEKLQHRIKASHEALCINPDKNPQYSNIDQALDELRPQIALAEYTLYHKEQSILVPLRELYDFSREDARWFMRAELVKDCASQGGCCARDFGCCAERASSPRKKGVGHCTVEFWCCSSSRGFEFSYEQKTARKDDWKSSLKDGGSPYASTLAIYLICPHALPEPDGR